MTKFNIIAFLFLITLTGCTNMEGLSKESTKPSIGNANSSILVEVFSDIQCPACRGAHTQILHPLIEKYGKNVRFQFKHFPIKQIHTYAQGAAEAAECAADQDKFLEFLDDSFSNQNKLAKDDLLQRAEKIGVADMDLFSRCVNSHIKRDVVQIEYDEGASRGVQGTPTFFVNGEQVSRHTLEVLSSMIQRVMQRQRL